MIKKKTPIQKNKNLIIILLSSILIIGISLGFILTRQESKPKIDVTMWSAYKSDVYSFEFRYPSPWVLVPYQHGRVTLEDVWLINKPDYILDIDKYSFIKNDFSSIFVSMTKFGVEVALGSKNVVYSKNTDLKEYVIERTGAPDSEIEKYKLDNKSGYMRTYKFGDRLDRQVFVKTTDGILTLGYREGQNDINSTVKSDFIDMLSTFKFTN
ncbi:hypothetical protein KBD45_08375 [Candidatus Dojkabacteria bacterium]|nr:hypothetical protein [Candidatus Dojkabacteria bacterium]